MYNNKGKRDILIFPKFNNMNLIQEVRNKYDRLSNLVAPHITLTFPFKDEMSNEELIFKLSELLKDYTPFQVTFEGVSITDDNYIFLNCTEGAETIYKLHNEIYEKIIPTHFKKEIEYIPHITLGQADNTEEFKDFDYQFTTVVDEVSIELIGDNEESIIIESIKLKWIVCFLGENYKYKMKKYFTNTRKYAIIYERM